MDMVHAYGTRDGDGQLFYCLTCDITDGPLCVKLSLDDVHGLVEVIERPNPRNKAEEIIEEHAQISLVLGTLSFSRKFAELVEL